MNLILFKKLLHINKMDKFMKQGTIDFDGNTIEFDKTAMKKKMQELCKKFPYHSSVFVNIKTTYKTSRGTDFVLKDPRTKISDTIMNGRNYEEAINQYISSAGTMLSKITDAESGSDIDIEGISQICISIVRPARII